MFLTCACSPTTLKIVPPPMRKLPVKQMFRTWMKTLLYCVNKYLFNLLGHPCRDIPETRLNV